MSADFASTWSNPASCARRNPAVGTSVAREADDGDVRIGVRDLVRLHTRNVGDHEIRRVSTVSVVTNWCPASSPSSLPWKRGRPQPAGSSPRPEPSNAVNETALAEGIELLRRRVPRSTRSWRRCSGSPSRPSATSARASSTSPSPGTRPDGDDRIGCGRQLQKARRRLTPYAPAHRGGWRPFSLRWTSRSSASPPPARSGSCRDLDLAQADAVEQAVDHDAQPPVAVEEEQQAQRDKGCPADDAITM